MMPNPVNQPPVHTIPQANVQTNSGQAQAQPFLPQTQTTPTNAHISPVAQENQNQGQTTVVSFSAELWAIICLMRGDFPHRAWLWGKINANHFKYPLFSSIYQAFQDQVSRSGSMDLPTNFELQVSPAMNEEMVTAMGDFDYKNAQMPTKQETETLVESLEHFRKKRVLSSLSANIIDNVLQKELTPLALKETIDKIELSLVDLRSSVVDTEDYISHIGQSDKNSLSIVTTITEAKVPLVIPSGIKALDDEIGGLPIGGLVLLAGTTKGGKSIMAQDIALHAYRNGYSVAIVGLELTREQYYRRIISNIAEIDATRMMKGLLSPVEVKRIHEKWGALEAVGSEKGNRLTVFVPPQAVTAQSILDVMKPFNHDILIIDQPSLLERMGRNEQDWEHLKKSTMLFKRYSQIFNKVVIAPVQVDESSDNIRYSRAQKENADLILQWSVTAQTFQKGYAGISVTSRDGAGGWMFKLKPDFKFSRWLYYDESVEPAQTGKGGRGRNNPVSDKNLQNKANSNRLDMDVIPNIPQAMQQHSQTTGQPAGIPAPQGSPLAQQMESGFYNPDNSAMPSQQAFQPETFKGFNVPQFNV